MNPAYLPVALDARDERVFDAVRRLLAEQGMQMSMDAVAQHAGCSKQTLYSRYGSKQELLRRVMQRHVGHATGAMLRALRGDDLRASLLQFATDFLEHFNQPHVGQACRLIAAEAAQFRRARTLYRHGAALTLHLAEWIETVCMQGQLRHDDPHFMAELLLSMIAGQDFDKQRFHTPIVMTRSCVGAGQSSPSTASCARSRHSRRPRLQPTGVPPDDRPPHPCLDVRRCCRAGCLQEAGTADAPPPEVGVIDAKPQTLPLQRAGRPPVAVPQRRRPRTRTRRAAQRVYQEGSQVKQGQTLFLIDPAPLRASLNASEAQLASARATYANARSPPIARARWRRSSSSPSPTWTTPNRPSAPPWPPSSRPKRQ